jgi:diaminopimelate epimerase
VSYPFVKGHGTENDFVVLPDPDGSVHGPLDDARVRALCDRRAGLGADGVLRMIRTASYRADWPGAPVGVAGEWFMDYRNADGSIAEMCGNGTRVFAAYLREQGLAGDTVTIATRAGDKTLTLEGTDWTVDLGPAEVLGETKVAAGGHTWPARHLSMGNPHAVAFVETLAQPGSLLEQPEYDAALYPTGVNVEFVVPVGPRHVAMRVHERGVGETRSCGTGAGAVGVVAMLADGATRPAAPPVPYTVDVPGGRLTVTWTETGVLLSGPAVLVARGETDL